MTSIALVTRRVLLREMGRAGMAILVIGSAACSVDDSGNEQVSSGDESSTTVGASASSSATPPGHSWERANLGFVSAYILHRNGESVVVDTGIEGSQDTIGSALATADLGWDSVGQVILTHKHPDHQGSIAAVLELADNPAWYVGAGDLGAIEAENGIAVGDDDTVFDLKIIETPGHTPGHISILDPGAGVLVAGDALNGADGGVIGANPDFSEDMTLANASVAKLATFDYEVALFGHGEPIVSGASEAVAALAETL
jgi:glyoxylase-like metal-dependent hydrolase (beta-lactamase superfamily II)